VKSVAMCQLVLSN